MFFILYGFMVPSKNSAQPVLTPLPDKKDCNQYYKFHKKIINLDKMKEVEDMELPADHFKLCSKYSKRFLYDENGDCDSMVLENRIYELIENYELEITEVKSGKILKTKLPVPSPLPNTYQLNSFLSSDGKFPIVVADDYYGINYFIWKFDEEGNLLLSDTIEKTKVTVKDGVHHHEPYLYYEKESEKELIFSCTGMVDDKDFTIVLSKADFTKKILPFRPCAYIPDDDEEAIEYYVWADTVYHIYKNGKTIADFDLNDEDNWGVNEGLLCDSLLVLAGFHQNSSGSSLCCVSIKTGKVKWYGDVLQMHIPHSKYSNQVILSRYKNHVLMEGDESGGNYLQVFDIKTGKRVAEFGKKLKK